MYRLTREMLLRIFGLQDCFNTSTANARNSSGSICLKVKSKWRMLHQVNFRDLLVICRDHGEGGGQKYILNLVGKRPTKETRRARKILGCISETLRLGGDCNRLKIVSNGGLRILIPFHLFVILFHFMIAHCRIMG
jgi:hypothetical protein